MCVEGLKSPGLETTICDIAFAICRDVSEPNKLMSMMERFRPQFLLVPAWSSSIHRRFEQQLWDFTERNHRTCSMVCNCCEALGTAQSKMERRIIFRGRKQSIAKSRCVMDAFG